MLVLLYLYGAMQPNGLIFLSSNGDDPYGKTYDPIKASKDDVPEVATSPPTSNGGAVSRDSLDEYDGSDDDFSEHGSFIGQYGNGKKASASQSSLPSYV